VWILTRLSLAVAVLDELGRLVGSREFSNDDGGHGALLEWIRGHDDNRVIGIEGTGNFGAALACRLIEANEDAREVPSFLPHRERRKHPSRGKSDLQDAVAIARVVARGEGLSSPQRVEILRDLKLLTDHRDQLVRARTQLINRTHKDLVKYLILDTSGGFQSSPPRRGSGKREISCARTDR
jgi:transposase